MKAMINGRVIEGNESSLDFWKDILDSYGFERDVVFRNYSRISWFRCGDFHIGFDAEDFRDKIYPSFDIIYHGAENGEDIEIKSRIRTGGGHLFSEHFSEHFSERETVRDVEEFLWVLDALSAPNLVPLAIGVDWAEDLVYAILQHSRCSKKALTTEGG